MDAYNLTSKELPKESSPFARAASHVIQPSSVAPSSPWSPGVWKRLPWTGFLALLTTIVVTILMIVIVVRSNGEPAYWVVQPAVLLVIASTIANILLPYALSEGVTVAWWVKSMKPGTQVSDLHNIWSFGSSIKEAALSGRAFMLCGTLCRGIVVVRYAVPWYYMLYRWYHLCGSKVASTSSPWFHSSRGVYIEPLIP